MLTCTYKIQILGASTFKVRLRKTPHIWSSIPVTSQREIMIKFIQIYDVFTVELTRFSCLFYDVQHMDPRTRPWSNHQQSDQSPSTPRNSLPKPQKKTMWQTVSHLHQVDAYHINHPSQPLKGHFRNLKWRYLPYIRPIREYPPKLWPEIWYIITNVPPFENPEIPTDSSWKYHLVN